MKDNKTEDIQDFIRRKSASERDLVAEALARKEIAKALAGRHAPDVPIRIRSRSVVRHKRRPPSMPFEEVQKLINT